MKFGCNIHMYMYVYLNKSTWWHFTAERVGRACDCQKAETGRIYQAYSKHKPSQFHNLRLHTALLPLQSVKCACSKLSWHVLSLREWFLALPDAKKFFSNVTHTKHHELKVERSLNTSHIVLSKLANWERQCLKVHCGLSLLLIHTRFNDITQSRGWNKFQGLCVRRTG